MPAIHAFLVELLQKTWMPATRAGMTECMATVKPPY